ncbi:MAG: segregation/condensation protein A [Planctomycetota bacterium]
MAFRVDLPVFSGPMDLLLHLIREREVDIHEIPIAPILGDYLAHLAVLQALDLADVGDFVVMASTLMEIKSRELLPREEVSIEEEFDPKDDLIRQLLEYKRFRDLSRRLERLAQRRARQMNPWVPITPDAAKSTEEDDGIDLGDVDVWTLTAAFAKLLEETGSDFTLHFGIERKDVRYYASQLLTRTKGHGEVRFEALFEKSEGRMGLIGTFTAMLELMKQGYLRAHQDQCFGEIVVVFVGEADATVDDILPPEIGAAENPIVQPPSPDMN